MHWGSGAQPVVCWTHIPIYVGIPGARAWRDLGCHHYSIERSHFPSLNLLLFLFCKPGLRIKIYFGICLGHYRGDTPRGWWQVRDYVSCYCRGNRCRQVCWLQAISAFPIRLKEKIIRMWDTGMGRQGALWNLDGSASNHRRSKQNKKGFPLFLDLRPPRNPRE